MSRKFNLTPMILGLYAVAIVLALIGVVAGYISRAADRDRLAEQSQQLKAFDNRLDAIRKEIDELEGRARRMAQRPPRGKIEETYDKFDVPGDILDRRPDPSYP